MSATLPFPAFLKTLFVALPCSQTPGGPLRQTIAVLRLVAPAIPNTKAPINKHFEAQSHGFTTCCLRLKTPFLDADQGSLPVGVFHLLASQHGLLDFHRAVATRTFERVTAPPSPKLRGQEYYEGHSSLPLALRWPVIRSFPCCNLTEIFQFPSSSISASIAVQLQT
jgi:hypothetical protein